MRVILPLFLLLFWLLIKETKNERKRIGDAAAGFICAWPRVLSFISRCKHTASASVCIKDSNLCVCVCVWGSVSQVSYAFWFSCLSRQLLSQPCLGCIMKDPSPLSFLLRSDSAPRCSLRIHAAPRSITPRVCAFLPVCLSICGRHFPLSLSLSIIAFNALNSIIVTSFSVALIIRPNCHLVFTPLFSLT